MTNAFPRLARLLNPQQFQDTFSEGRRINGPLFRLHVRFPSSQQEESADTAHDGENAPGVRLGIAVSKRVDARAVGRNRIKRVARESFRAIHTQLPGGDYVLLAQREAARADNTQLALALNTLWIRVLALDRAPLMRGPAAVTMSPRDPIADKSRCTPELP